ncbi:MAG: cytochrome C oxidase subunit IV family protein [Bacteroidetes bacterium]|nr:cytochrome C oxidase subunit IV family protein [Bacteroidota bacterium]MBS1944095.1 cytochrome C oxidase subunit IV family protein [Bacteroidota bacterium]
MERDDIIEYSLDAVYSEDHGRVVRKKIFLVAAVLTVITLAEVFLGIFWRSWMPNDWHWVKWVFIMLTLVKASYIVMTFMHLGDERRNFRSMILIPYSLFLMYLVFIIIWESTYLHQVLKIFL